MAVTLFVLRMRENLAQMEEDKYQVLQNSRLLKKLSNFSSAIGDGNITPAEIASVGDELFEDALEFMDHSDAVAQQVATEKASEYEALFGSITASEYYQNSGLMQQAQLYFDPDTGAIDTEQIQSKLYEQTLKDYANEVLMPILKEKEVEIQNENDRLQTEIEQLSAEYDSLKQSKSQEIQRQTIQLS